MKATKYALAAAFVLIGLLAPGAVRADTIVFNVSGVFTDFSTLSGTVTIDTALGFVQSLALTSTGGLAPGAYSLHTQSFFDPTTFIVTARSPRPPSDFAEIVLVIPADLSGYLGGPLCSDAFRPPTACREGLLVSSRDISDLPFGTGRASLSVGSLTPTPVPEPSSLYLLGTGLLGLLGAMRRKWLT